MLQASAKWRLFWRLAPRLLKQWDANGRLAAIYAGSTRATKHVRYDMLAQMPCAESSVTQLLAQIAVLACHVAILAAAGSVSFAR